MRAVTDDAVTALAILATVIVVAPLVAIFGYLVYKGASSLNLAFFTQIPKPPGRDGRRHGQRHSGLRDSAWPGQLHRRSHRHRRRNFSGRVRARHQAGQCECGLRPMCSMAFRPS